jgi:hypothetical protein
MLGSADKRPLSAHSGPSPRYVTVPRYFYLIASIALTACTSYDIQPDPVYRETIVRHTRPQVSGEQFDRQEYKSELASIFSAVDVAAERRVGNVARDDNFIFAFWAEKKRLLSKDYGIKWSSPAELSPTVEYAGYGQPRLSAIERRSIASFMKPHLDHEGEEIHHMRRTFDGTVYVYSNYDAVVIQHTLSGHDETWNYENSGELVFD